MTVFLLLVPCAVQAQNRTSVLIGAITDGQTEESEAFFVSLRSELKRLLGGKYTIRLEPRHILSADWQAERAKRHYHGLAGDAAIDLIIGAGVITTTVLAAEKSFPKPVLAIGMIDPAIQGVAQPVNNRSGIVNFSYILFNRSFEKNLRRFLTIVAFKKVAVIAHGEQLKLITHRTGNQVCSGDGRIIELIPVPVSEDSHAALAQLGDADAAYLGYLGSLADGEKDRLIRELTARGIPTYGFSVSDVHRGALAAAAPEENWLRLVRRMALNIESVLAGKAAADLPVQIDFDEQLTINMQTARRLGISPKFSVLSQSVLINEFTEPEARRVTLTTVMQEASRNSLEVIIEEHSVGSAREDISRARADWLPSLSASGDYTVIDRESAQNSFGTRSYVTTPAALDVFTRFLSREAVAHAPEVARLDATLASRQRQLLSFQRKRFIPELSANAQARRVFSRQGEGADLPGTDPADNSWSAGLDLTWPLYLGGGIGSNIRKTRIEIRKLKDQKQDLIRSLRIKVRAALNEVVNKAVNLDNARRPILRPGAWLWFRTPMKQANLR